MFAFKVTNRHRTNGHHFAEKKEKPVPEPAKPDPFDVNLRELLAAEYRLGEQAAIR
jgi:hypothetical protein